MSDDVTQPEILAGTRQPRPDEIAVADLAEARQRRAEAEAATPPADPMGLVAGPKGVPEGQEAPPEAPQDELPARTPLADQLVMFVSADGLRRFEKVNEPWLAPPQSIDLACPGKQKVIVAPGGDVVETRRYHLAGSIVIRDLGLVVHHFQER